MKNQQPERNSPLNLLAGSERNLKSEGAQTKHRSVFGLPPRVVVREGKPGEDRQFRYFDKVRVLQFSGKFQTIAVILPLTSHRKASQG